jgi:folate-binding protein YgfZ
LHNLDPCLPACAYLAFTHRIPYLESMPSTYSAELVSIEGPDAVAFAQSQFSSNVAMLANGQWQFSGWLDAKGRVRALFHLVRLDELHLRLLLRGGEAEAMVAELSRFVFRSKVRIAALQAGRLATTGPMLLHAVAGHQDALVLGCGSHGLAIEVGGDGAWRLEQLRAAWPWLPPGTSSALLPAWLDLVRLGAVALDKGCYPGQEIVARMHYRGGSKRHLGRVSLSSGLPPGSVLETDGGLAIQLLDVLPVGDCAEALAVVPDELRDELAGGIDVAHEGLVVRMRTPA